MTSTASEPTLVARLLGEAIRDAQGCPGVLVRDVPHLHAEAVLTELEAVRNQDVDLRIAYLNPTAAMAAQRAGIPEAQFSTQVEDAERWRNTPDLDALVVVIAEADAAKLTSLEEFAHVGPTRLRALLVQRAAVKFSDINDVLPRWWNIIGHDEQISFSDLIDYYSALQHLDGDQVKEQSALQINRLGLLPDPGFFDNPAEKQLRSGLAENRTLALRLANFSEEDRIKVNSALDGEKDPTRRAELRRRLRDLQEYRRGGLLGLTAADAQQLLKIRSRQPPPKTDIAVQPVTVSRPSSSPPPPPPVPPPPAPPPTPRDFTMLAVESLLRGNDEATDDRAEDTEDTAQEVLDLAAEALHEQIEEEIEDSTVRPKPVTVTLPSGVRIDAEVQTDVLNLINRMVGEGKYGGLVRADGGDITAMVRNFQQSAEVVQSWDSAEIREYLDSFARENGAFEDVRRAFDQFEESRNALLPHLGEVYAAPMLVAAAPGTQGMLQPVIESYQNLLTTAEASYGELHQSFGDDARALIELLMLLDTVFFENEDFLVALLTPLHPLLLWHYFEYAHVLDEQRNLLDDKDRKLVRSEIEASGVPFFLASLGVPRSVAESAPLTLSFSGKFGGLPHFSERATAPDSRDGIRPIRRLIEAFIALHPSAARGFRLALLEPPPDAAGTFLPLFCDLADSGKLQGAHITILRRGDGIGAELNLSADEERRVQRRFGDHASRRFTFETQHVGPGTMEPPAGCTPHLFVAFDQTERLSTDAGGPPSKIQPLANRHRLVYRIKTKTLDLEPALGGILADYSRFAKLAIGTDIVSYHTVHQTADLRARLSEGAKTVPWYVIADGHIDRDLELGSLRVLTSREGTRAVAAFTKAPDAFRRILRDVVRRFNTYVTDAELDELLHALSDLLDAGLLSLRPGQSGDADHAHVKGILGLLVAVQSLRDCTPERYDRIILSLDDEQAQRWLHLSDDPRRADLLVIDGADNRFTVTVVEVKARRDVSAEYTITAGNVEGPAVKQVLSIHRLLRRVFEPGPPDVLVTPSRREILREHLYRELSKARYDSDTKSRWAARSRQLFDSDTPDVDLRCALIDVQLGVATASLEPSREVHASDGTVLVPVAIRHVNEKGVPALEEALTPPEVPPDEPAGEGGGQPPSRGGLPPQPRSPARPARDGETPGAVEQESAARTRPRVFLGHAATGYSQPKEVWFDPQKSDQALNNPHISISGETGSGKTQAAKAILHDFLGQGLPALILDFKDDYSKSDYATAEGFTVHDASFGSLPFNPMVPPTDPQSGRANPIAHVHELANMLQRIYKLGDQQAFQLREAMKETYEIAGIGYKPFTPSPDQAYLPFEAIRDVLQREEANTLLGRLSPVFDLGLFNQGDAQSDLAALLSAPTVIRLSQLPGDQVKNAVAEFFLMALYSFLIRREQPHRLEQLLVLDEAWRLVNSPFLEPLMREGRAFGLGVIIATQFPKDLPDQIAGSTATRLFFSQTKAEQVREIQRTLLGKTSGSEADHLGNLMRGLAPLECILQNIHYRPWIRLRAIPYYARVEAGQGSAD